MAASELNHIFYWDNNRLKAFSGWSHSFDGRMLFRRPSRSALPNGVRCSKKYFKKFQHKKQNRNFFWSNFFVVKIQIVIFEPKHMPGKYIPVRHVPGHVPEHEPVQMLGTVLEHMPQNRFLES